MSRALPRCGPDKSRSGSPPYTRSAACGVAHLVMSLGNSPKLYARPFDGVEFKLLGLVARRILTASKTFCWLPYLPRRSRSLRPRRNRGECLAGTRPRTGDGSSVPFRQHLAASHPPPVRGCWAKSRDQSLFCPRVSALIRVEKTRYFSNQLDPDGRRELWARPAALQGRRRPDNSTSPETGRCKALNI